MSNVQKKTIKEKKLMNVQASSDYGLRSFSFRDDWYTQSSIGTLQHELFVTSGTEEVAHSTNQNKPAHDHEHVGDPLVGGDTRECAAVTATARSHRVGIKIVAVGIRWRDILVTATVTRRVTATLHIEPPLNEREAETRSTAVLRGVGGVQEIGQQKPDQLEGHGYHGIPHKGED